MPRSSINLVALVSAILLLTSGRSHAIIAGVDAAEGEFPWIAGIVQKGAFAAPALIGGGALLGDQWVITAAHSVEPLTAASIEVWMGSNDLDDPTGRVVRNVLAIYVHPDFATGAGTSENDLALLLLDEPVSGIPLLPVLDDPLLLLTGDVVSVAGWGTSTPGLAVPTTALQKAPAEIISNEDAAVVFGTVITDVHLAAVDPAETATPCVGDSGSPLVKNIGGTATLVGLVSFGSADCEDASLPTIYTRIPLFAGWIDEHLDLTTSPPGFTLIGRSRTISDNADPKERNGTDFGNLARPGRQRSRTFVLENAGAGLLTVRSAVLTGRGFRLRRSPSTLVGSESATSLKVTFRAPRGKKRFRSRVVILNNDPARPAHVLNLQAKVRR
jgi:secreted trypsin-like serine protease